MHIMHSKCSYECISIKIVSNTRFCLTFLSCVAQTENTWLETLVATKQFFVSRFNVPFCSLDACGLNDCLLSVWCVYKCEYTVLLFFK